MANHAHKGRGKSEASLTEVPRLNKRPSEPNEVTFRNENNQEGLRLRLDVLPKNSALTAGHSVQFSAVESDADGTRDVTENVFWKSHSKAVTIDARGLATGVHAGGARITATTPKGLSSSSEIVVSEPQLVSITVTPIAPNIATGQNQQFVATGNYSDGSTSDLSATALWSSSTPAVATVNSSGLATAVSAGAVTITAASGLITGSSALNVAPASLVSILVTPLRTSIAAGQTQQFTAAGNYSDGTTKDLTGSAMWASSVPAFATISATGLATGVTSGAVTITATSGAMSGSSSLSVAPAALVSIAVTPLNPSIAAGQTQQFTATGAYSDGTSQDLTATVAWTSSAPAIAAINGAGLATGAALGSATITAAAAGVAASSVVTVSVAVLVAIVITPPNRSIAVGQSQQFTATGTYSDGTTRDLTGSAAWTSTAAGAVSINAAGLATAVTVGSATIMATSGGMTGSSVLTVPPPVVQSIAVTSTSTSVGAGQTRQFLATATYSDGSTKDVTATATWSSSNTAVAIVNNTGLATGGAYGAAIITATYTDASGTYSSTSPLNVLITFTDLGDADVQSEDNQINRVNQFLTAFERRGNLSTDETNQLKDALELVTQYLNNNPSAPIPNFNAASKVGNNLSDLQQLGIPFNTDPSKGPIGTGSRKANVIDDRFRAICDYLYGPPPVPGLEHDPGSFPGGNGPNPGGLTDDQLRVAAVYGYIQNTSAAAPPYRTMPALVTPDDNNRRAIFNQTVEAADAQFRTYRPLYVATLARLIQISQTPQIDVSDWSRVVDLLVKQGITATNPQLSTWIDRALATAQNVGQDAQPSDITINLPDLEQDVSNFEIITGNIFALQPAYFCSMLEELKVFQVVEKLVELFQNGVLPVVRGDAGNLLFAYWKDAALRVSEAERRGFYARSLGFPGGDADSPNRDFKDLFMRFVSAVSSFVRQNTVDNILRSNIPGAISQQQVRKSGRDLATNISSHGYGIAYPMATELQKEINNVMAILKNDEIQNAYGAKDMWQLVDQVAGLELGGAKNSVKYRTMASSGATVFAWLATRAQQLSSTSYMPILDITQLFNAPSFSTKPTTNPSDFDLVGACDQWLAVTGTQEDSVEQAAQPTEAPIMPSRPIQIPSVARDMLESVGVPAMSYAASAGKTNGSAQNWRYR